MDNELRGFAIGICLGVIVGATIGYFLGDADAYKQWKKHAIENNYGKYNEKTGAFEFVLKTEKK